MRWAIVYSVTSGLGVGEGVRCSVWAVVESSTRKSQACCFTITETSLWIRNDKNA